MGYEERIERVIGYIEEHLQDNLSVRQLADVACFSPYHFCRIFQMIIDQSPMAYVRMRRLAASVEAIRESDRSILRIAMDFGFNSRDVYTRAFKRAFGMIPGACRARGTYPVPEGPPDIRVRLNSSRRRIQMIQGLKMRIVEMPELKVAGYGLRTNPGRSFQEIPEMWQRLMKDGSLRDTPETLPISGEFRNVCLGLCSSLDEDTEDFMYIIGWVVARPEKIAKGLEIRTLPPCKYAVFTTVPTDQSHFTTSIQLLVRYVFTDWLPHSEYEYDDRSYDLEWYDERCAGDVNLQMDVLVPIKPKTGAQ